LIEGVIRTSGSYRRLLLSRSYPILHESIEVIRRLITFLYSILHEFVEVIRHFTSPCSLSKLPSVEPAPMSRHASSHNPQDLSELIPYCLMEVEAVVVEPES